MQDLKAILEHHYNARNTEFELSLEKPDPLFALKKAMDEKCEFIDEIAVLCALLAYGNAGQILKTLLKLDFRLLGDKKAILAHKFPYYRFQSSKDIKMLFLALNEIIARGGIKSVFVKAYKKAKLDSANSTNFAESSAICGINAMICTLDSAIKSQTLHSQNLAHKSQNLAESSPTQGLKFLIGQKAHSTRAHSPLKRWNLFLRWMVRKDNIDLGLWSDEVACRDLILPLDTHTFRLSQKLGLLNRKSYDLRSALEITANLAQFCENDPVKYDFALYRLGQEKIM